MSEIPYICRDCLATFDEPEDEHLLMFVIGGNGPKAEFSPEAMEELREKGLVT